MRTSLMTIEATFLFDCHCQLVVQRDFWTQRLTGTFDGILASEWKHVTTVTTPIGGHVGIGRKPMRDSMIDFLLVPFL